MKRALNSGPLPRTRGIYVWLLSILLIVPLTVSVRCAYAQGRLSVEFRPSANFPTSNMGDVSLKNGGGFEAVLAFQFMPHLGVYGGWGRNAFTGSDMHFEETGYTYGVQFLHPIKESNLSLMLRGGGVYNHIETENSNGDTLGDSGHGTGWQVEGGISIPVSRKWSLRPGLRYHSLTRNLVINGSEMRASLNYLSLGLGVCWQF